jgi:Na+-driven multidrug efflux pump
LLSSGLGLIGAWIALPIANFISFIIVLFWANKYLRRFKLMEKAQYQI